MKIRLNEANEKFPLKYTSKKGNVYIVDAPELGYGSEGQGKRWVVHPDFEIPSSVKYLKLSIIYDPDSYLAHDWEMYFVINTTEIYQGDPASSFENALEKLTDRCDSRLSRTRSKKKSLLDEIKSRFELIDNGSNDYDNEQGRYEISGLPMTDVWEPDGEEIEDYTITIGYLDGLDPDEEGYFKLSDLKWLIKLLNDNFYTLDNEYTGDELIDYVRENGFLEE